MDGCHLHTFQPEQAERWMNKYPEYKYQLGPGEDDSQPINLRLFDLPCEWISFPTGCLIDNLGNKGEFNRSWVIQHQRFGKKIRGHNCDFLTIAKLCEVACVCNGYNIAPQLGTIQSSIYIYLAHVLGLSMDRWYQTCVGDQKNRKRWGFYRDARLACGHYHFDELGWRDEVRGEVTKMMTWAIGMLSV
jgi:hypothetical protein